MKTSIKKAPIKGQQLGDNLTGIRPSEVVYICRDREPPKAVMIDKVTATHAISNRSGLRFRLVDGLVDPCAHAVQCYGRRSTPELRELDLLANLRNEFERTLARFRSQPELQTKQQLTDLLKVLDPGVWA